MLPIVLTIDVDVLAYDERPILFAGNKIHRVCTDSERLIANGEAALGKQGDGGSSWSPYFILREVACGLDGDVSGADLLSIVERARCGARLPLLDLGAGG